MAREDAINTRSAPTGSTKSWQKWIGWVAVASACAVGLQDYRIDNDLSEWVPHLRATGLTRSYAVVGFQRDTIDERALAEGLCDLPTVEFCADRHTIETGGQLIGVTPDEFVIGRDRAYEGIFLFPRPEASDDSFIGDVRRMLDNTPCDRVECFDLGGPAVFHIALNQVSQVRLSYIMLLILLLGGALLWCVTGSFRAAWSAMGAITLSQIVLVGALSWLRLPLDVSLSMVPPLMMSFGFSYAAHRALRPSIGRVLALCVATTALGFGTFVFADVPPVKMFAIAGSLGLAVVWVAVVTLVPELRQRSDVGTDQAEASLFLRIVQRILARHALAVVGGALILSASVVSSVSYLRFETNPLNYFPPNHPLVLDMTTLNERLTGMLSVEWSVGSDGDLSRIISRERGVRKIVDITRIVSDGRRHLWCLADNDALPSLIRVDESLRDWAEAKQVQIEWRGVAAQLSEVSRILAEVAIVSLPAMGLVAALVVGLLCRSILFGLISLWVNLLPVGILVLVVVVLDWPLDLPSLMIGAIAIGMAIDDTLHIALACQRTRAASQAVAECFRPCAGSSLVTAACLSCFAISTFGPIRQFGVMLAMAAFAALLADVLLLPALWRLSMHGPQPHEDIVLPLA